MMIKYLKKSFDTEKYISEFMCFQKLHFCMPVTLMGVQFGV